jgi:hypothetical protein
MKFAFFLLIVIPSFIPCMFSYYIQRFSLKSFQIFLVPDRLQTVSFRSYKNALIQNTKSRFSTSQSAAKGKTSSEAVKFGPLEVRRSFNEFSEKLATILNKKIVDVPLLQNRIKDLETESGQPGFWENQERAQETLTELSRLKNLKERIEKWISCKEDTETLLDLSASSPDDAGTN